MVTKKRSAPATTSTAAAKEPTKAELQRRMEAAREDISQTVEEIKDTVTEQYESVKETVTETLDWREQFRKHSIAWSLGALTVGFVVGNGIAAALQDAPKKKGHRSSGFVDEIYAIGEKLSEEFSEVAQTILLPALGKKIRDKFGVDVSDKLRVLLPVKRTTTKSALKRASRKSPAKKGSSKKSSAKKSTAKRSSKKSGTK
jgi:hypothetical protein